MKKRLKKSERHRQILENAAHVFATQGYEGAKTREIAEACEINEALLYRHFPSKLELFREVINSIHDDIATLAKNVLSVESGGLPTLKKVIAALIKSIEDKPDYYANTLHSLAESIKDPEIHDLIFNRIKGHNAFLTRLIEQGIKEGTIRSDINPVEFSSLLLSLGYAFMIVESAGIKESLQPCEIRTLFDLILDIMIVPTDSSGTP